ncbi:bifunctional tetrahydrofolate synthase/dihydrofolate synthase [Mesosutterella sp. OilRF-GAM-744-9]|uniref:Dihydrofolate synthase/folylpolyglutamate synthase n=1 Tax=Mesosutterella porci TaxID=2915351 RepID=A0ABS9MPW4_9BURK|nr:bifunctional tetrahydrofolate synthase/dihydrofolate synthase [Mesosutterella sp. oilRF-744-WT-GAM-9]MCG5030394.1 bifunctional tetrahydrofolate synthase/dihydrofolate synthase [Mesosutterella sp. oilRF-744-WT-GAM-9]
MAEKSLSEWLAYIEDMHGGMQVIDLGLERMQEMIRRLGIRFSIPVFTVAGTNGKGSTCAILESVLRSAGLRVGMHTSPHMLRFNERAWLLGREATDDELVAAFSEVEAARGDLKLSYFEFTGLAILRLFQKSHLDALVLEIGLGARLDAINAIDPTVSIVTTVGIDHTAFLGPDRESIGREKSFVYRGGPGHAAVCADRDPPESLLGHAREIGADLRVLGRDFDVVEHGDGTFDYRGPLWDLRGLPRPALAGEMQLSNAAGAIAMLEAAAGLRLGLPVTRAALEEGLRRVAITGRFQTVSVSPRIILDAGHNPHAARELLRNLRDSAPRAGGRTIAVVGMLRDKDRRHVAGIVKDEIDLWRLASLTGPRASTAADLAAEFEAAGVPASRVKLFDDVASALDFSIGEASGADRIIVFGSFVTVSAAIEALRARGIAVAVVP